MGEILTLPATLYNSGDISSLTTGEEFGNNNYWHLVD
jgi:hypothetical protein